MRFISHLLAAAGAGALPLSAFAHDGHGMEGLHWHASDTTGFVVVAALAALALWLARKD